MTTLPCVLYVYSKTDTMIRTNNKECSRIYSFPTLSQVLFLVLVVAYRYFVLAKLNSKTTFA